MRSTNGSQSLERGLVLLRAFTKLYAMPGLRLGYALSSGRTLLSKPTTVAFACVDRFELCLLTRRNKVSVFFEVFDDLFLNSRGIF